MPQLLKQFVSRSFVLLTTVLVFTGISIRSNANPAIVIDVDSGRVLYSDQATDPWYPASITKLMTAYVAMKAVRDGRLNMDSLLTVSQASAKLPPSKMGFKPGSNIRLDNALKIIMVKSANDVANTIAEGVGGTTDNFVAMMNQQAQRLGMYSTRFVNPHGLPDNRQQTSARDMAILGRTMILEFPEYNYLFHIGAIQYGKRVMYNTNGLIGRYAGADGMKTGFICASGFNVVATATRGNTQLLTVVLGAHSANERTLQAAYLFDKGFSSSGFMSSSLDSLPASSSVTPPNLRSQICDKSGPLAEDEDGAITTNGNSDSFAATASFGSGTMAYADSASAKVTLGKRAKAIPEKVWLGMTPSSVPEEPDVAKKPKAKPLKGAAPAKKTAQAKQGTTKLAIPPVHAKPPARPK
ncbi:D-alanyl-D-alanine carboxypeptidase family protein [Microvirga sp. W0021]|uniref:D-alanyl-D-alanine carboxypeptidase family protein n=1 Tax=Hohaiivirga grylli TaxID=3133970 RepID=A0ABV0BKX7_9HYPH